MTQLTSNVSPLIPHQFPGIYREQEPQFVEFIRAYYQWLEQEGNTSYYARRIYDIKDVDKTFDQFIVYFKEKYLKNLVFDTVADIRMVIKHALDIYHSKGTERCNELLFRIAFDKNIAFYYPSTDLFKLSDGNWTIPQYLELTLEGSAPFNTRLEHKEVIGLQSNAVAFVDSVIRRKTNNRLQDIAYISAITGNFKAGEKIQPTDKSLTVEECPTVTGSLNDVILPAIGSGLNYNVGDLISVSSNSGQSGLIRVANTVDQFGIVDVNFVDGGWGFQTNSNLYISNAVLYYTNLQMNTANLEDVHYFSFLETITQPLASINYVSANGTFLLGANVFTYYPNNALMGSGSVIGVSQTNSTAGLIIINVLSGNVDNTFYTTSNGIGASIAVSNGYTDATATGKFIANATDLILHVDNVTGFLGGELVYQPIGPEVDQKFGGWGTITAVTSNTILLSNVEGRFVDQKILETNIEGIASGATANVIGVDIKLGVVNTVNQFVASPYSYAFSSLSNGVISSVYSTGSGFSMTIANTLLYPETISYNTDKLSDYANVAMAATTYGFPANPTANATSGTMGSVLSYASATIGKLGLIYQVGAGTDFQSPPFIIVNEPHVSNQSIFNAVLEISSLSVSFSNGEVITQGTTNAKGMVIPPSNSTFLYLQRLSFANNFIATVNSATLITGSSSGATANVDYVDYDFMEAPMGRNATISSVFSVGSNTLLNAQVVDSGFGFVNGESISIGSNGAVGIAVIERQGKSQGFYSQKGGFLSDQKKLFDGWYYQNFSYDLISPIMLDKYQKMIQELTHVSGTKQFATYVYNTTDNNSLNIENAVIATGLQYGINATMKIMSPSTMTTTKTRVKSSTFQPTIKLSGTYIWVHANGAANTAGNI